MISICNTPCLCHSMRKGDHKISAGFLLVDSLIAIAIFVFVTPVLMQFLFRFKIETYVSKISTYATQILTQFDVDLIMNTDALSVDVSEKNCDMLFSSLFTQDGEIKRLAQKTLIDISTMNTQESDIDMINNTLTSIEFIGKTKYGAYTFLLGANSASTTLPDLFVFTFEIEKGTVIQKDKFYLGPGVVDIDTSPKIYNDSIDKHVGLIERSIVTPFWASRFTLDAEHDSARMIPVHAPQLNLAGAYPQTLKQYGDMVVIGTQKSLWSELVIGKVTHEQDQVELISDLEIGTGVQDLYLNKNQVWFASALNPEFQSRTLPVDIKSTIYQNKYVSIFDMPIQAFDAPGELGNGKNIQVHPYGLFLGRTIGNLELYAVSQRRVRIPSSDSISATATVSVATANPNISTRKMVYTHDGYGLIVLTNDLSDAIKIYIHRIQDRAENRFRINATISEILSLDLDAKPTDLICIGDNLLITTESNQSPLVMFSAY